MAEEYLEAVRQHYRFSEWNGVNKLDHDLVIENISVPKNLIDGLKLSNSREHELRDGSRLIRTSWVLPDKSDSFFLMDIRECASRESAHLVLLELLANMQAPDIQRLSDNAPGDVAFGREVLTFIIFARGNIAVSIANGGREIISVEQYAKTLDTWIVEQH